MHPLLPLGLLTGSGQLVAVVGVFGSCGAGAAISPPAGGAGGTSAGGAGGTLAGIGAPVGAAPVGGAETGCTFPLFTKSLIEPGCPLTVVVTFTLDKLSKVSPG